MSRAENNAVVLIGHTCTIKGVSMKRLPSRHAGECDENYNTHIAVHVRGCPAPANRASLLKFAGGIHATESAAGSISSRRCNDLDVPSRVVGLSSDARSRADPPGDDRPGHFALYRVHQDFQRSVQSEIHPWLSCRRRL